MPSRALLILVLIGAPLLVRCAMLVVWRHSFVWGDGLFYATIAEQFFRFGRAHDYLLLFPPGYSLATAVLHPFLSLDAALVCVSTLAGSIIALPVWWIGRMVVGERAAWSAWGLCVCSPLLVGLSMERLADSFFIMLVVCGVGSLSAFCQGGKFGWFVVFSLCSALSIQVKPEGLVLVFFQSVLSLFLLNRISFPRRAVLLATLWLAVALVGAPYWLWLHQRTGRWLLSGKAPLNLMHAQAKDVALTHGEELQIVYRQAFALDDSGRLSFLSSEDSLWTYFTDDPARAARVYVRNVRDGLGVLSPGAVPLVVAAALGLVFLYRDGKKREMVFLLSPLILLVFPPIFVSLAQPSFHPGRLAGLAVPLLVIPASRALERLRASPRLAGIHLWVFCAWCFACLVYTWHETDRLDRANRVERRAIDLHVDRVSSWILENTSEDSVIASTSLLDDAYGGRRSVWLPWDQSRGLFDYLDARGVDYVIQEQGGGVYTPGFEGLREGPESAGWRVVAFLDTVPPVAVYGSGAEGQCH